ncbi:hypothetical protein HPB50_000674 [Hyalomma asiaticum]|uniref:Uncharacterized protein n=1 Tax=Hyalomma asiaticum TaxID=266040 RepID=A0ACB7RH95_HYAAI|nr:hypothetical protein HPB50_000674 [Hyalomma asiaticum]
MNPTLPEMIPYNYNATVWQPTISTRGHASASTPWVLLSLTLKDCFLTDKFAVAAAKRLRSDIRLRLLDVTANEITIRGLTAMIDALGAHRSPETFAFSVRPTPTPNAEDEASFLEVLRNHGTLSRLHVFWSNPPTSSFSGGINLCTLSVVSISLEYCKDRLLLLDAVATSHTISAARFISSVALGEDVNQGLVKVICRNRHIRSLDLCLCVTAHEGLTLLRALKGTAVEELELSNFIFDESSTNALCAMVSANRCINKLAISIADTFNQEKEAHRVCHALVESLKENYVLASLVLRSGKHKSVNEFDIRKLMCRNMMQVHEAVQFVVGSDKRRHALAFDVQKDSRVLREKVSSIYNLTEEEASTKIAEALVAMVHPEKTEQGPTCGSLYVDASCHAAPTSFRGGDLRSVGQDSCSPVFQDVATLVQGLRPSLERLSADLQRGPSAVKQKSSGIA